MLRNLLRRLFRGTRTADQTTLCHSDPPLRLSAGTGATANLNAFATAIIAAQQNANLNAIYAGGQQAAGINLLHQYLQNSQIAAVGLHYGNLMQSHSLGGLVAFSSISPPTQYRNAGPYDEPATRRDPLERQISVGELIGWRIWRVRPDDLLLESYSAGRIWLPGEPMTGKPSDHGPEGIWAFKEKIYADSKAGLPSPVAYAVGSIWLWGEVIEHSVGWRAEFAEIRSIDAVVSPLVGEQDEMCDALRHRYGFDPEATP